MSPPAWMTITQRPAEGGYLSLDVHCDVLHEDVLPALCDYLRATGRRALIPGLRAAYRRIVAASNAQDAGDV